MRNFTLLSTVSVLLALSFGACNTNDLDNEVYSNSSSSVIVSGFSIKDDKKVLDSLSNVFFSIDLVNARIFNADSLPYGTKVNRLIPSIKTASYASAVTLKYFCPETNRDSVVNYLTNPSDSIDFSHGPVILSIRSQSGAVTRDYQINVNVHQVKADSLAWYRVQSAHMPESVSNPTAQRTVKLGDTFYSLTAGDNAYSLASTLDPSSPTWSATAINPGFDADVNSLSTSDNAAFMLDTNGNLYTSPDLIDWTATGAKMSHLYGGYCDQVLGCTIDNGIYSIVSYPSDISMPLPDGFPVSATSQPIVYSLPMGYGPQFTITGGKLADGSLSPNTWSYDGSSWYCISKKPLPQGIADATVVPYALINTPSSTWVPQEYNVLMLMGGRNADNSINRQIYISRDWGMTWNVAPDLVKLPDMVQSFYGASAFVYTSISSVESRAGFWSEVPVKPLYDGCSWMSSPMSRVAYPVTQWRTPEIYVFGGYGSDGTLIDNLWRAVILQYTFKPVE